MGEFDATATLRGETAKASDFALRDVIQHLTKWLLPLCRNLWRHARNLV